METLIMIISILLIAIVLLQSGKAEGGSLGSGVSSDLFSNRKDIYAKKRKSKLLA